MIDSMDWDEIINHRQLSLHLFYLIQQPTPKLGLNDF